MNGLFRRSIMHKEKIMIVYIDHHDKLTQRIIQVLRIHHHSILAYCYYRKHVRQFKLANILSAGSIRHMKRGA